MRTELRVGRRKETEKSEQLTHPHSYRHKCLSLLVISNHDQKAFIPW